MSIVHDWILKRSCKLKDAWAHDWEEVGALEICWFPVPKSIPLVLFLNFADSPHHVISFSPGLCRMLKEKVEHGQIHVNEKRGDGTKEWLHFHLLSASRWPLPPEHCISWSCESSGSKNNGRETGNTPCHFVSQTLYGLRYIWVILWLAKFALRNLEWGTKKLFNMATYKQDTKHLVYPRMRL